EVSPDGGRVNPPPSQVAVRDARRRVTLHVREQVGRPLRLIIRLQRSAPLARAVPGHEGCSRSREVIDVLQERLPRVAGWSAEDPRRADAQEEQAIVGGVPLEVRPPAPSRLSAAWCSYRKSTRASGNVPPIFGRGHR